MESEIDVRWKCNRKHTEVTPARNRCGTEVRSLQDRNDFEVRLEGNRNGRLCITGALTKTAIFGSHILLNETQPSEIVLTDFVFTVLIYTIE